MVKKKSTAWLARQSGAECSS